MRLGWGGVEMKKKNCVDRNRVEKKKEEEEEEEEEEERSMCISALLEVTLAMCCFSLYSRVSCGFFLCIIPMSSLCEKRGFD